DWATRQTALADQTTIWQTYGATSASYSAALSAISGLDLSTVDDVGPNGYISNQQTRTIWVQLVVNSGANIDDFATLFGASLYQTSGGVAYWADSGGHVVDLSLPESLISAGVTGIAFDTNLFDNPIVPSLPTMSGATLQSGSQSPGNSSTIITNDLYPQQIAQ